MLPPRPQPASSLLLFPPFFSKPACEMAAHQSLQPLTAAALCWGESITGVGSAALDQSPGRPSPACGHCVISFEGRAEPVRKLLAPKMFPEESQLGTGLWSTTLRGSLLWVL